MEILRSLASVGCVHEPAAVKSRCRRIAYRAIAAAIGILLAGGATACTPVDQATVEAPATSTPQGSVEATPPPSMTREPAAGSALEMLGTLAVKGRAPLTGYERDLFAWRTDTDRNGCDTRNDILARDLVRTTVRPGTGGCVVLTGTLHDPYTGDTIVFERERSTIDIDHVVALANAWQTGAAYWTPAKRVAFANDPLNLLAVGASVNQRKSDGDAATWLPPDRSFRCAYVARQVAVKAKYELWITQAERDAIARVLASCPGEPAPRGDSATAAPGFPTATGSPSPGIGTDPRFDTCTEAKAAGYGPYERGVDPEYGWYNDADDDGRVCE